MPVAGGCSPGGTRHRPPRPDRGGRAAGRGRGAPRAPAFALDVEPQVGGDLVVAAPARVQLGAGGTGQLGDPALDRGVDVLVGRLEHERARRAAPPRPDRARRGPRPLRRRRVSLLSPGLAHGPASRRCRPVPAAGRTARTTVNAMQLVRRAITEPPVPQRRGRAGILGHGRSPGPSLETASSPGERPTSRCRGPTAARSRRSPRDGNGRRRRTWRARSRRGCARCAGR